MDPLPDQILRTLSRHWIALGGLAVAVTLGSMIGGYLRPNGLLEEPKAAQLISSTAQAEAAPEVVVPFPASTANRPWVVGTDALKASEPPLTASYDGPAESGPIIGAALADKAPPAVDSAIGAADEAPAARPPDA